MMGVVSIAMGLGGIGLILTTVYLATRKDALLLQIILQEHPVAFPTMLLCSLVLLVSLIASGILLFKRSERALRFVLWLYALEIAYCAVTSLKGGVYAAGNIGLFPQIVSAFPIWGFIVLWWASKQSMRLVRPGKR
jgi:hypothetical protein